MMLATLGRAFQVAIQWNCAWPAGSTTLRRWPSPVSLLPLMERSQAVSRLSAKTQLRLPTLGSKFLILQTIIACSPRHLRLSTALTFEPFIAGPARTDAGAARLSGPQGPHSSPSSDGLREILRRRLRARTVLLPRSDVVVEVDQRRSLPAQTKRSVATARRGGRTNCAPIIGCHRSCNQRTALPRLAGVFGGCID